MSEELQSEDFYGPEDTPPLRLQIDEAIGVVNDGLRMGLFPRQTADMLAIAKVLHLRQIAKQQPDIPW